MGKWIIILIMVLFATTVFADSGQIEIYKPREIMDLSVHLTNKTGAVTNANCTATINNESYNLIENLQMNEVGAGWYNATYNTSKTGKYFCTQNCTRGNLYTAGTCDFVIIGGDMSLATFFALGIIFLFYIGLVVLLRMDLFSQHGLIKSLVIIGGAWFMLIPINLLILFNNDAGASAGVISNLNMVYQIAIWINYILTFYIVLWVIISMINHLRSTMRNKI